MSEANRQHDERARRLWRAINRSAGRAAERGCPGSVELAEWLDGRADAAAAERIEAHLADCPACLAAVVELRAILAADPMPAPAELIRRASELVGGRPTQRPRLRRAAGTSWRLGRWAAAVAAGVLVSYAGYAAGAATRDGRQDVQSAVVREATFGLENGNNYDADALGDDLLALLNGEAEQ